MSSTGILFRAMHEPAPERGRLERSDESGRDPTAVTQRATRHVVLAGGVCLGAVAVLTAAGWQAGVSSSAAQAGSAPSSTSLEWLAVFAGLLAVACGLIAWGATSVRPYAIPAGVGSPNARKELQSVRFVGWFVLSLGVGLLAIGTLEVLPVFCISHGPDTCQLAASLLVVPHLLDVSGAILGSAGGLILAVGGNRRRTPSNPPARGR